MPISVAPKVDQLYLALLGCMEIDEKKEDEDDAPAGKKPKLTGLPYRGDQRVEV